MQIDANFLAEGFNVPDTYVYSSTHLTNYVKHMVTMTHHASRRRLNPHLTNYVKDHVTITRHASRKATQTCQLNPNHVEYSLQLSATQ